MPRSRITRLGALGLLLGGAGCVPSGAPASTGDAPIPGEVLARLEPPRTLSASADGRAVTLQNVARVHGRPLSTQSPDSLSLRVVRAWNAQGRELPMPLGTEVRLARREVASLEARHSSAAGTERRVVWLLLGVAIGYGLFLLMLEHL